MRRAVGAVCRSPIRGYRRRNENILLLYRVRSEVSPPYLPVRFNSYKALGGRWTSEVHEVSGRVEGDYQEALARGVHRPRPIDLEVDTHVISPS
jgi:hypothetical protein